MLSHFQDPIVVKCATRGYLTLFAVHGDVVHALRPHEGTDILTIEEAQLLACAGSTPLLAEHFHLLRLEEEWMLYRCKSKGVLVVHVGGPLVVIVDGHGWSKATITEGELKHPLMYEPVKKIHPKSSLRTDVRDYLASL